MITDYKKALAEKIKHVERKDAEVNKIFKELVSDNSLSAVTGKHSLHDVAIFIYQYLKRANYEVL